MTLVNKRMLAESEVPRCLHPSFSTLADLSDAHLQSMVCKKIHMYMSMCASPAYESLIADALSASSTGKHNAVLTHNSRLWQTQPSNTPEITRVTHKQIRWLSTVSFPAFYGNHNLWLAGNRKSLTHACLQDAIGVYSRHDVYR